MDSAGSNTSEALHISASMQNNAKTYCRINVVTKTSGRQNCSVPLSGAYLRANATYTNANLYT